MKNTRPLPYLVLALVAILVLPTVGHSQFLANPPNGAVAESGAGMYNPSAIIPASTLRTIHDSTVYRNSYWQEGLVAGGAAGVIFGAMLASGFCAMSETASDPNCGIAALKGAFLLGATGATVGALVGGIFSKPKPPPT